MFLLVISFYSYSNTRLLIKNAASVSHTHEVQESIEKILSEMTDMETGQRGFIITGNLDFLAPYRDASLILDQNIENLRELTSDNPVQQEHIKEFIALKDQKIGLMKESIESRKAKGFQIAKSIVVNNSGKVIMDALRDVAKKMHSEEDRLLNLRNAQADESTHTAMSVIIGGACISLLI
ncbi:MAG: CHASE3 domain-containing protein, partial [Pseudobdellovibrio sp.]